MKIKVLNTLILKKKRQLLVFFVQLFKGSLRLNLTLIEDDDVICMLQDFQIVGRKDSGFRLQQSGVVAQDFLYVAEKDLSSLCSKYLVQFFTFGKRICQRMG